MSALELDDLITGEQYHQHTRPLTVARLLAWLYGWTIVMLASGAAFGHFLRR